MSGTLFKGLALNVRTVVKIIYYITYLKLYCIYNLLYSAQNNANITAPLAGGIESQISIHFDIEHILASDGAQYKST